MKLQKILNQIINEQNNGLVLYHCSPYNFDKFDTANIGKGTGRQDNGWGFYFSTNPESIKSYGKYMYEVTLKGEDLTFIDFKEPVPKDIVSKIVESVYKLYNKDFDINEFNSYYNYVKDKSLPKVEFNDFELIEFDYSGFLFYRTLSRTLNSDKKASLFLLDNGIVGIKNKSDYIIFDTDIINIKNKYKINPDSLSGIYSI
jgi:hypothetical protein